VPDPPDGRAGGNDQDAGDGHPEQDGSQVTAADGLVATAGPAAVAGIEVGKDLIGARRVLIKHAPLASHHAVAPSAPR